MKDFLREFALDVLSSYFYHRVNRWKENLIYIDIEKVFHRKLTKTELTMI